MEVVGGQREGPGVDHQPGRGVGRGLGIERPAAPQLRGSVSGRHGGAVDQIQGLRVDGRLDVEGVLLARRRGAESGADAAAHRDGVPQPVAGRQLAVRRRAEHVEALDAHGAADGPAVVGIAQLHVAVEGDVGTGPGPGRVVGKPRETVGARNEALRRERTDLPRRPLPGADGEALVPPFRTAGHVDHVGGGVGDVEVEVDLRLPVETGIEIARGVGTERCVDGVEEEEVRLVGAVAGAGVPRQAVGRGSPQAGDRRKVGDHAVVGRGEPTGRDLLQGEAVRVVEHPRQGRLIRPVGGDLHGGTASRAVPNAVARVEHVANEQRLTAVETEDVGPRIGVPVVEPLRRRLVRVVGVAVELQAVGMQVAEVAEQLQVVLARRVAPGLRGGRPRRCSRPRSAPPRRRVARCGPSGRRCRTPG